MNPQTKRRPGAGAKKAPVAPVARRAAYPLPEFCYLLGGISVSQVYARAKAGDIKLIDVLGRTMGPHSEVVRLTGSDPFDAPARAA